jgi:hypothetical protein
MELDRFVRLCNFVVLTDEVICIALDETRRSRMMIWCLQGGYHEILQGTSHICLDRPTNITKSSVRIAESLDECYLTNTSSEYHSYANMLSEIDLVRKEQMCAEF